MTGSEAIVKIVGLCVLGGIAQKVLTVIAPRTVETLRSPLQAVGTSAAAVTSEAAKRGVEKLIGD